LIVDSSALVAIIKIEPEAVGFLECIGSCAKASMSAAAYLETGIVVDRDRDPVLSAQMDELIAELEIEIAPVTASQANLARQAYRDFGKGSGHKAQLNFGDCFAYALAAESGEQLLYKGDDFAEAGMARIF
jgi:ribonuclease VapC